ncbi:unnamed protein product [Musa banksii]
MQHYNYGISCFSTSFSRVAPTELCASISIFHGWLNNDYFDLTAIATVVTIAEILKTTALVGKKMHRWLMWRMRPGDGPSSLLQIEILLGKTENFVELMVAATHRGSGDGGQH